MLGWCDAALPTPCTAAAAAGRGCRLLLTPAMHAGMSCAVHNSVHGSMLQQTKLADALPAHLLYVPCSLRCTERLAAHMCAGCACCPHSQRTCDGWELLPAEAATDADNAAAADADAAAAADDDDDAARGNLTQPGSSPRMPMCESCRTGLWTSKPRLRSCRWRSLR